MELKIKKTTLRDTLNKALRIAKRIEITKLSTSTVTVRNVYKNKQIIDVSTLVLNRCSFRI
jgi:hypothetical protein